MINTCSGLFWGLNEIKYMKTGKVIFDSQKVLKKKQKKVLNKC